jgi:LmbE family N-acetylglucosaminyl deacetylase
MDWTWPDAQYIYLSPHLDDVALSCGGTICAQVARGEAVAVITIFAGSPSNEAGLSGYARMHHERWQASAPPGVDFRDPAAARRVEDIRAWAAISRAVQVVHLPLTDCIYRCDEDEQALYTNREAIFGTVQDGDPAIAALASVPPLPDGTELVAPLGVGYHVDHQIVQAAVKSWGIDAGQVRFYEDYPYAVEPGALRAALGDLAGWTCTTQPLDERTLAAKLGAVAQYESQISTFWQSIAEMAEALRGHAAQAGGERFWMRGRD